MRCIDLTSLNQGIKSSQTITSCGNTSDFPDGSFTEVSGKFWKIERDGLPKDLMTRIPATLALEETFNLQHENLNRDLHIMSIKLLGCSISSSKHPQSRPKILTKNSMLTRMTT